MKVARDLKMKMLPTIFETFSEFLGILGTKDAVKPMEEYNDIAGKF